MKTILLLSAGAILQNAATNHPNVLMLVLAILAGFAMALLVAFVFVGPTPKPPVIPTQVKRQPSATQTRKVTKRQPKKDNFQIQHGIDIYNYPQGAYA